MGRFKFCMIVRGQTPIMDVDENSLRELYDILDRQRYLVGRLI